MKAPASGFLVVLATNSVAGEGPVAYQGVDRVPAYPGDSAEEARALDFYVFGECKDPQTNLIPSIEAARELLARLSQSGGSYEIILCCKGPNAEVLARLPAQSVERLGFDVAAIQSDYWSIVDDFSTNSWAEQFRGLLNEHGLFRSQKEAERYLRAYRQHDEPDSDSPLDVVYVARLALAPK